MYKIKFLDSLKTNREQTETAPIFREQYFGDVDLPEMARWWKLLGLKRIESIEIVKPGKRTIPEVIELLYPEYTIRPDGGKDPISEHDKRQKAILMEKYKK